MPRRSLAQKAIGQINRIARPSKRTFLYLQLTNNGNGYPAAVILEVRDWAAEQQFNAEVRIYMKPAEPTKPQPMVEV
jgi:hypothetical protein